MSLYFLRAGKCLLRLAVLLGVVVAAMSLTGTLETRGMPIAQALFLSQRGVILMVVVLVWAGLYPLTSFTKVSLRMDFSNSRQRLIDAFATCDYVLESEAGERMTFRARSGLRRALWQWDDRVTVVGDGGFVDIEGLKRIVPRVETRLKALGER